MATSYFENNEDGGNNLGYLLLTKEPGDVHLRIVRTENGVEKTVWRAPGIFIVSGIARDDE